MEGGLVFLDLRMVTFSNLIIGEEWKERGDLLEKMERDLRSEGSMKEGESIGLVSKGSKGWDGVLERGGSSKEKGGRFSKVDKGSEAEEVDKGKWIVGIEIEVGEI